MLLMDQQGLHGVADGRILAFGVESDLDRHVQVRVLVHIGMANAGGMSQHRDPGGILDGTDQLVRTAGDDQVHQVVLVQKLLDLLPGGQELDRVLEPLVRRALSPSSMALASA